MSATSTTGRAALVAANGRARRPAEPPQGDLSHAEAQRDRERRDMFWFGNAPEGWSVGKMRSVVYERREKYNRNEELIILSLLKDVGVIPYSEKGEIGNKSKEDHSQYKVARKGDLVINSMNVIIGSVGISPYDGYISPAYYSFVPREDTCMGYIGYLCSTRRFQRAVRCYAKGIMEIRLRVSSYDFLSMPIPLPPLPEQKAIVAYLDAETERIDKAIAAEEKMIALLQERREIVINEAVGGGDLSHAEAQRGRVRRGWEVRRLKSLLRPHKILVGKHCNEYDLLSLTLRGIVKRDMDNPEGKFPASFETYQEVNPGEFVFCMFDNEETPRAVGLSSLRGMITGAYDVMSLIDSGISSKYLNYYFLWIDDGKRLKPLYKGLRKTVPLDSFMTYKIPLPPLPEQEAIVERLDRETGKIDRAIEVKRRQIELLRERRQIVIDEVVTGSRPCKANGGA